MIKDPPILTIRRNFPRPSDAVLRALRNTPTGFIVDCMNGRGALDYRIKPLDDDNSRIVAPIVTSHPGPGANLAVFAALATGLTGFGLRLLRAWSARSPRSETELTPAPANSAFTLDRRAVLRGCALLPLGRAVAASAIDMKLSSQGLSWTDLRPGTGAAPTKGQRVTIDYLSLIHI